MPRNAVESSLPSMRKERSGEIKIIKKTPDIKRIWQWEYVVLVGLTELERKHGLNNVINQPMLKPAADVIVC